MVASLTGFGRFEHTDEQGRVSVELKSVNNRFLQLDVHLPYHYSWADILTRKYLGERISRGKVGAYIDVVDYNPAASVVINRPLLEQFFKLRDDVEESTGKPVAISLDGLLAVPGVVKLDSKKPDNDESWQRVLSVLSQTTDQFLESRKREGENMAADIINRTHHIRSLLEIIEGRFPGYKSAFIEKFVARINELASGTEIDRNRIELEAALWTDRSDISEEVTRLKSHLAELEKIMSLTGPVGRRLDFLVQELHREANTITSKSGDLEILQSALDMKCEIEKIREQAQNIE